MVSVIEALRYMIGAAWEGEREVKQASDDIRDLGNTTDRVEEKSRRSWSNIGRSVVAFGAVAGSAMLVGKKLYQALGEGADLLRAEDQFGRLAASIDSTADSMMGRLRTATSGMVTDAELVASATQIMSLGLQDTEDGVVRLTAVAGKLGWDMSQVILTMANDSKMRLDALGLSIEDVDAKTEALVAQGYRLSEAFDLAVIEAGEEKYRLLGDAAVTTAGQMKILETAVVNATDEFKTEMATAFAGGLAQVSGSALQAASDMEVLTGAIGRFFGALGGAVVGELAQQVSAQALTDQAVALGLMTPGYASDLVQRAKGRGADPTAELALYQQRVDAFNLRRDRAQATTYAGYIGYGSGEEEVTRSVVRTAASLAEIDRLVEGNESWRTLSEGMNETTSAIIEQEGALTGGGFGGGGLVGALDQAAAAMANVASESGSLFASLRGDKDFNLGEELFDLAARKGMSALRLSELGVSAGLFDQGRANELLNRTFLLQSAEQLLAGNPAIGGAELLGAVQGLQGMLGDDAGLAREFFGNVDAAVALTLDTAPANDEYMAWAAALPSPVITPVIDLANASMILPGGVVINNYGGEAVATQMALLLQRRSKPQDSLLGRE